MSRLTCAIAVAVLAAACLGVVAYAQQPAPPPFATTKVDGTDNVYVFRYGNHQSMFVVTSAGVIATDPIGYGRPQAVVTYVDEIKKVSSQPIKYLVYSHQHFDHIAGGKPFKDAGATIIAHKRAKEWLVMLKDPHTVLPDETVDTSRTITLGDTTLELTYIGRNHSDSTLVMRLPKQKVLFAVDQAGRAGSADVPAGRVGRGEDRGPGRQVLGRGREGAEAAEVPELARIRAEPAVRAAALLRPLGPRLLIGAIRAV